MSSDELTPLEKEASEWGIQLAFTDVLGRHRKASVRSLEMVLESMRSRAREGRSAGPLVVVPGHKDPVVAGSFVIRSEDGAEVGGSDQAVSTLVGPGYHQISMVDGDKDLIVAPRRCLQSPHNVWGLALQLYASRSRRSWGMGDLKDLAVFGREAAAMGAKVLLVNPMHASLPGTPQEPSPYFPSSRCFGNPLFLSLDDLVGEKMSGEVATAIAQLNDAGQIDRDGVWRLKDSVLQEAWTCFSDHGLLDAYISSQGEALRDYATFCALGEVYGRHWRSWPHSLSHPRGDEVESFRVQHTDRIRFYAWIQMLFDAQVNAAGREIGLLADVAVGVDPNGADAWLMQDDLALDMRVGAPPDEFNSQGQNWGVPPLDPWSMKANSYEALRRMVSSSARGAAGIRVDHVMGLFRLYWIPEGSEPDEGVYVRYPYDDLLATVALESHRSECYVVGEDLGTIEDYMRDELQAAGVLSYKVMWFENRPTWEYPAQSMATVTTHDLPTVAGVWTGRDLQNQLDLELAPDPAANAGLVDKARIWAEGAETVEDAVVAAHTQLGRSSSAIVAATAEDMACVQDRPNYPGTVRQWPNWSMPLPVLLDDLLQTETSKRIVSALQSERKG